ncbi:MAG: cytochrome c [Ardenticatenaceae bacterium]|nr:cytochrome c [Ardenticatenaceae bacterium]
MRKFGQHPILYILTILFVFAAAVIWWSGQARPASGVQAAAKVIPLEIEVFAAPYSEEMAQAVFEQDPAVENFLQQREHAFIQAVPLSEGESRRWAACAVDSCAHILYYNFEDKGTIEGVVNLRSGQAIDLWQDRGARPLASTNNLRAALEIAAADQRVTDVLGEISADDLMMVPMNIWLLDDDCLNDWCVDLTFHDPVGSGKIFHVTVNMEQQAVARTFYTRGRPARPYRDITPQRNAFSDGCHEGEGWAVCWQMTAHDGVEFYDAQYDEKTVFSTAKIGQVEVWYPSWPGGYRDEIGFSASVPPYFDTELEEFDGGFTISQLFTEFARWPNCICCYRYEQIMSFYEDGTFEARFVSHGPGCDDLSIYQPMWRFDLDLDDPNGDEVWVWETDQWREAEAEEELELILDRNLSPEGQKVATFDGDLHYRWSYIPSDPLGLDEAKMFLLRWQELEGENPILTGPANTFQPPRQWIDGDAVSGENVVLWYVPLLKTKKGGPWFCMPEPGEEGTPCEAVLRVNPAEELPTAEEVAEQLATIAADPSASPTPSPDQIASEDGDTDVASDEEAVEVAIEGDTIEDVILNAGCAACHVIGPIGDHGKVGPDLTGIAAVADSRVEGQSAREYLRSAILYPNDHIVADCPNGPCLADVMPDYYGERLSAGQLEDMISYLLNEEIAAEAAESEEADVPQTTPTQAAPLVAASDAQSGSQGINLFLVISYILIGLIVFVLGWLLGRRVKK